MILLFFGAVLLSCATVLFFKRETDAIKCVALGICFYFMSYVFVTAGLFFFEIFSLMRAVGITFLIWVLITAFMVFKTRNMDGVRLTFDLKEHGIAYLVTFIFLLTFSGTFGYFGMGQDQGVYQVEAINLMYGKNEWHDTITEYKEIEDEKYKAFYWDSVKAVLGFNFIESAYSDIVKPNDPEALEGIYHGLPAFPATLALFGSLFGLGQIVLFQKVFYVISLLLTEYILRDRGVGRWMRAILLVVYGVSPQVVWISKSSLTEGFLAVLVLLYLMFIMDEKYNVKALSVLPILTFCFWHLSAFSMFPVFAVNFWLLYFMNKEPKYLRLAVVSLVGLAVSFAINYKTGPIYFVNNYVKIFSEHGIDMPIKWVAWVMIFGAVVGIAVTELLRFLKRIGDRALFGIENIAPAVMAILSIADFINGRAYWGNVNFPGLIGASTIMAYITLTGFFVVPLIMFFLIKTVRSNKTEGYYLSANFFAWAILFYSSFLRMRVMSYYYNSRYIMPYFGIIIILFGLVTKERFFKSNILHSMTVAYKYATPIVGICIMLPFTWVVRNNQDDTNMQWKSLEAIMARVSENDVVYMDNDEMMCLYYPLRAKGARIYPVLNELNDTTDKVGNFAIYPGNTYYLSDSQFYEDDWKYEVSYEDRSRFQMDDSGTIKWVIFWPTDFTQKGEDTHILYKLTPEDPTITASDGYFISGWSANASGHRWMNAREASLYVYLTPDDYKMKVVFGERIPFEYLSIDSLNVDIYVNDKYMESVRVCPDMAGFEVIIKSEELKDGRNIITFKAADNWTPSEYGSPDLSEYVFSIDKISFKTEI